MGGGVGARDRGGVAHPQGVCVRGHAGRVINRLYQARKVDIGLPEKGNSNFHGAVASPPNHLDDKVDSDQSVVNKELSLIRWGEASEHATAEEWRHHGAIGDPRNRTSQRDGDPRNRYSRLDP